MGIILGFLFTYLIVHHVVKIAQSVIRSYKHEREHRA